MKEATFVHVNIARWEQFEREMGSSTPHNPERLARLYILLTDDLAYARTHYPRAEITAYLNSLAAKVHGHIYRNKREKSNRLVKFWLYEIPEVAYRHRKTLLYSFLIFAVSALIGAVSTASDETFARLIMGDRYINMTEANIDKGDPMAVYKGSDQAVMFLGITLNNIRVALMTFAAGITLSLGSAYLLFSNGVMLGAFQYFFYQKGLLSTAALTIWIHGTLEISAIIIAGAAGIIMGNSIMFPGTYSRMTSLRKGAKEGIKLATGLVPIFITAGFLEGFVTRLTDWPDAIKIMIIALSASFIIGYFIIYPRKLAIHGTIPKD